VPSGLNVAGLSVQVRPGADGRLPVVVCIHGAADRAATFARLGRWLPGPDLVRYDRRGYGRSEASTADVDAASPVSVLESLVDDLFEVLAATASHRKVVLVGHSVGGVVALAGAARDRAGTTPQVVAVVAYEPPMAWAPWWSRTPANPAPEPVDPGDAMEDFLRRMIGDDQWEALPASARTARRAEGPALQRDLAAATAGGHVAVAELAVPVVFGWGTATTERHRRAVTELAEQVGGPVEVHALEGAGHGAHLTHPQAFAALIDAAIAKVPSLG
jgi:pimeloyl-ACP methyl ester carboxylesterase